MNFKKIVAMVLAGCYLTSAFDHELTSTPNPLEETTARGIFQDWIALHNKLYETEEEVESRFSTFKENMKFIMEHNAKGLSFTVGLNNMADLTKEEYRQYLGYRPSGEVHSEETVAAAFTHASATAEDSVDWRQQGAVTPVKNQQQCGSCWAFSTTGSVEGIHKITSGTLVSVSEQELVDCDKTDNGCGGGAMENAMTWIVQNGGIDTEGDYGYTAADGQCNVAKEHKHVVEITGHVNVPAGNEEAMKKAVSKQPVSVAIEADQAAFQLYRGGVFESACGTQLDHGVLVVGYGTEGGEGYWIVKNSWGATWGEEGYIRMKQGVSSSGICGILLDACYPTASGETKEVPKIATVGYRRMGEMPTNLSEI